MALMMGNLYFALIKAGATDESARAAAEEVYMACASPQVSRRPASGSLVRLAAINLALTFVLLVIMF